MSHVDVRAVAHAEELVVRDVRRGDPTLSFAAALEQAVETVDVRRVVGDDDDEEAEAWRIVLAYRQNPLRRELVELVRLLSSEDVVELSTIQNVWVMRAQRGELR